MFYVKKSEKDNPYLENWSNEPKPDYVAVPAITDEQIIRLTKFTKKCYLTEDGVLVTPHEVPLSVQERQTQEYEKRLKVIEEQLDKSQLDKQKQAELIGFLIDRLNSLGNQAAENTNDGGVE